MEYHRAAMNASRLTSALASKLLGGHVPLIFTINQAKASSVQIDFLLLWENMLVVLSEL